MKVRRSIEREQRSVEKQRLEHLEKKKSIHAEFDELLAGKI